MMPESPMLSRPTGAVLALLAALAAAPAAAQSVPLAGSSGGPVEIEASQSVEWQSELKIYVARGNARLRQGDLEVSADVLTAHYRETATEQNQIWRATALGNVVIRSTGGRAVADRAVYELDRDVIVLTGGDLRLEGDSFVITARDSLEYWQGDRLAVARGGARVVRGDQRVDADLMTGQFEPGADGNLELNTVSAFGNVLITTPTDVASANQAVYNLRTELATLTGGVRLSRGANHLNGDLAEVNMATGVSRLLADPGGQGRVRGLLVPDR